MIVHNDRGVEPEGVPTAHIHTVEIESQHDVRCADMQWTHEIVLLLLVAYGIHLIEEWHLIERLILGLYTLVIFIFDAIAGLIAYHYFRTVYRLWRYGDESGKATDER